MKQSLRNSVKIQRIHSEIESNSQKFNEFSIFFHLLIFQEFDLTERKFSWKINDDSPIFPSIQQN